MQRRIAALFAGEGLAARAMRGAGLTVISFGGQNALRLGSNLILTRILFPEAFGLMALVQVFVIGLQMFSDIGLQTSVIQNKRGEDPRFLDTAWSVQVLRGFVLWALFFALAWPAAAFYDEPALEALLPIVGLNAIFQGFLSINIITVNRKLMLGRLTMLELGTQALGIVVMIALAPILLSVWALVIGTLVAQAARTVLSYVVLPGRQARPALERAAFGELFSFGKWIFLSTLAGFLLRQGDRAILGKYITLEELALYNIAFFLAAFPEQMNSMLVNRVLFPLYVHRPPKDSVENRRKIFRARYLLTAGGFALSVPLILFGDPLIRFLYDPRYHEAGLILAAICLAKLMQVTLGGHGAILLANGASKVFAGYMISSATIRTLAMLMGAIYYGIPGVIIGTVLGQALSYPLLLYVIRPFQAWDWRHDALFFTAIAGLLALAVYWDGEVFSGFLGLAERSE